MIRRLLLLVAVLLCASHAQAAVTVSQERCSGPVANGDRTITFLSNLTTGRTVLVSIGRLTGAGTYSVSDATNGAYVALNDGEGNNFFFYKRNITGGLTNVSIDDSADDGLVAYCAWELAGADNVTSVQLDFTVEGSATSHICGDNGITGTGFFACSTVCGDNTTYTAGGGWTASGDLTDIATFQQYVIKTGSTEHGAFTNTPTINCQSTLIFFAESSGGGGGGSSHRGRVLVGVG